MEFRHLVLAAALCAALTPAARVSAEPDWEGLVGGVIGGIISDQMRRPSPQPQAPPSTGRSQGTRKPAAPRVDPAVVQANQATQSALRYFGYYDGAIDGDIGPISQEAIGRYQGDLGYGSTGQLTQIERDLLLSSYDRARVAGITGTPDVLRDYQAGREPGYRPPVAATPPVSAEPSRIIPSAREADIRQAEAPRPGASFSDLCTQVDIETKLNNGYQTAAALSSPGLALSEQACLIRDFAAGQAPNMSNEAIVAECGALAEFIGPQVAGIGAKAPQELIEQTEAAIARTGYDANQVRSAGISCLGGGYRAEAPNITIASALLLVATGEPAYAEVLGHHLNEGIGIARNPTLAAEWYGMALAALEGGAQPAFMAGQTAERASLIRAALDGSAQSTASALAPQATIARPEALRLPNFGNN